MFVLRSSNWELKYLIIPQDKHLRSSVSLKRIALLLFLIIMGFLGDLQMSREVSLFYFILLCCWYANWLVDLVVQEFVGKNIHIAEQIAINRKLCWRFSSYNKLKFYYLWANGLLLMQNEGILLLLYNQIQLPNTSWKYIVME